MIWRKEPRWPPTKADKLAQEVQLSASRAAYIQDPNWPSIDIYSGIAFKRRIEPTWGEEMLGWQFALGGDGILSDNKILEEQFVSNSPYMIEIRGAIETIFKTKTEAFSENF